jgi:hypothetical protein
MSICRISLIILIIVIIWIIISGVTTMYYNNIAIFFIEKFSNTTKSTPSYMEYNAELELMNISNDIGMPPGILKTSKNTGCDTNKNILVQKQVTFKPTLVDNGNECTSVEKVWL